MSPEWVQVRLRRDTYARLRAFGARVLKLTEQGRLDLPANPKTGAMAADVLVAVLLDRDDRAQQRNKDRSRQRLLNHKIGYLEEEEEEKGDDE